MIWPEIRTARLVLRPAEPADVHDIFSAVTPTLTRYLSFDPAPTPQALEEVISSWRPQMMAGTDFHMAIRDSTTGAFIGMAGAHHLSDLYPELGIWIREDVQRQGYGREAVQGVRNWFSLNCRPNGFRYLVAEANIPSHQIARSLGGTPVGIEDQPKFRAVVYRLPIDAHERED
jgi:RimJ/RimL family protein N-acetyltransferase